MARAKYEGPMKDGIREGDGTLTWPGRTFYKGGFHAGLRHGYGHYQLAEPIRATKDRPGNPGRSYTGSWRNGQRHGQGKEVWPNGDVLEGHFRNGKASGPGTLITRSGSYEGQFLDGMRCGKGTFEWHNGAVYEGEWKNGIRNGHGSLCSPEGRKYEGEWKNGDMDGQGTFTVPGGMNYVGEFKQGKNHGLGTLTFADGRKRIGIFKENKPWDVKEYDKFGNIIGNYKNGLKQNN